MHQSDLHQRLLTYTSDAVAAFMRDMERIGRADDVVMLMFSEFGRRVPGEHQPRHRPRHRQPDVRGRQAGQGRALRRRPEPRPSSTSATTSRFTTDFRRVYATVIEGWLGYPDTSGLLGADFAAFPMFA